MDKNYRHIEEGFLSPEECQAFINMAEEIKFEEAMIQVRQTDGTMGQEMNKDVRDNFRVVHDSKEVADALWEKIKRLAPEEDGWLASGLNERLRFYRYEFGQQFKRHVDGAFKRSDDEISKVTVLIYLNDDFSGGATQFIDPFENVIPKIGMLLLFKHRQLHQGDPVTTGRKYVLRTDIMYKRL